MKKYFWLFLPFLIFYLGLNLYQHRVLFKEPFDQVYWQERFDTSQWRLPLSKRIIGDDGLYLHVGNQLTKGADPTLLNAEHPPLAKYLIGLSIWLFNNGQLYGAITYVLILLVFFFLAKEVLNNKVTALATTTILAFDPLLTNQFPRTMLDNTQLLFLLVFFFTFIRTIKTKTNFSPWLLASSISLGFFSAAKLPILTPLLIVISSVLFLKQKRYFSLFILVSLSALTYFSVYFRYFLLGNNPIEWLKVQKWMITFHQQSELAANRGSFFTTLFANQYQNLFSQQWEQIETWSFAWPIVSLSALLFLYHLLAKSLKKTSVAIWILFVFILGASFIFFFVPFWPRYLLLILPLLYLLAVAFLDNLKKRIFFLLFIFSLLISNLYASIKILFPTPQATVNQLIYDWENGFFEDVFQQTVIEEGSSEAAFIHINHKIFREGQVEAIKITLAEKKWSRWQSKQTFTLKATYFTRNLGPFNENKELQVVKKEGRWRVFLPSDWLIKDLTTKNYLETQIETAKRGSIFIDQVLMAGDVPGYQIWITANQIQSNQEEEILVFLERLFQEKTIKAAFHQRYVSRDLPGQPILLGTPSIIINQTTKNELEKYPGIKLTKAFSRVYFFPQTRTGEVGNTHFPESGSRLYSTTIYDGLKGIEKEKNEILKGYNGGSLKIKNNQKEVIRTLIETERKDGQDVYF